LAKNFDIMKKVLLTASALLIMGSISFAQDAKTAKMNDKMDKKEQKVEKKETKAKHKVEKKETKMDKKADKKPAGNM
jgi:hypothetical protein